MNYPPFARDDIFDLAFHSFYECGLYHTQAVPSPMSIELHIFVDPLFFVKPSINGRSTGACDVIEEDHATPKRQPRLVKSSHV